MPSRSPFIGVDIPIHTVDVSAPTALARSNNKATTMDLMRMFYPYDGQTRGMNCIQHNATSWRPPHALPYDHKKFLVQSVDHGRTSAGKNASRGAQRVPRKRFGSHRWARGARAAGAEAGPRSGSRQNRSVAVQPVRSTSSTR